MEVFQAPVQGWVTNSNIATQPRGTARRLDNYFPTQRGIRPRLGTALFATIDTGGDEVFSMFAYRSGASEKLFASDTDTIFEVTSPGSTTVPPTGDVTGLTSGDFSTQMFSTSAGDYLYALNGDDSPELYDGTTWTAITGASSPAITGVTTNLLSAVWAHGNRLWFVEKGTKSAWYLAVDSIAGAATEFILTGVFKKGGALLFGTTWSLDTGDGMDDKCCFVSTEGEVAVYSGTDPSSASTWSIEGVYEVSPPLGKNSWFKIGGEPFFLTREGAISLGEVIRREKSQQSLAAISLPIEDDWQREAKTRNTKSWKAIKYTYGNMILYATPSGTINDDTQYYVQNMETGAWARWINWDINCGDTIGTACYVGTSDGTIYQIESGGSDAGAIYECTCVLNFDDLGVPEATKTLRMARANFTASNDVKARISASKDYSVKLPSAPSSISAPTTSVWDTGLWDSAVWSAALEDAEPYTTMWKSIGRTGYSHALQVQQTFGIASLHFSELQTITCVFEVGGVVV